MKPILLTCLFFTSCAHSTIYLDGRPVAYLQADVHKMSYRKAANGEVAITIEGVNHSAPTKAQGLAGSGKLSAWSQIITAAAAGAALKP